MNRTMHRGLNRSERVEARVTSEQKNLILRAAELRGLSLTDFMVQSAQSMARATIRKHQVISLSVRDSIAFANAILAPKEPNDALRAAFARHNDDTTA